jgi:tetratricopeptide (TPR) repeat protein
MHPPSPAPTRLLAIIPRSFPLALFGWGKKDKDDKTASGAGAEGTKVADKAPAIEFNPAKAASWFKHANVAYDSENFEYAMTCWLSGLRFEPTNLDAVKSFFNAAARYAKPPSKDMLRATDGKTDVDKFLYHLLQWGCKTSDADLGVKTVSTGANLGLTAIVDFLAPKVLALAVRDQKPRKSTFVELMKIFQKINKFDLAAQAGEQAIRLDPTDTPLQAEVRNLSAQSTMSKGGYDQTGEAGGFRANVRDIDKQRTMEEQERVVKSVSTVERLIEVAKGEYEANPTDKPAINKYAKILLERGTPEDEKTALDLLTKAHADTQEFRFRQAAGEIRIRQARRALRPFQQAIEADPNDPTKKAALAVESRKVAELEAAEYQLRVTAYPTDLTVKFELGKRLMELGQHEQAIDLFQQSKSDGRLKAQSLNFLAQSFQAVGFDDEAIETYRQALEVHSDPNDAVGMELRYGLCTSLQRRATEMKDLPSAEEAYKLASNIVIQQVSFKDIRQRRDQIKAMLIQLKGGAAPG